MWGNAYFEVHKSCIFLIADLHVAIDFKKNHFNFPAVPLKEASVHCASACDVVVGVRVHVSPDEIEKDGHTREGLWA